MPRLAAGGTLASSARMGKEQKKGRLYRPCEHGRTCLGAWMRGRERRRACAHADVKTTVGGRNGGDDSATGNEQKERRTASGLRARRRRLWHLQERHPNTRRRPASPAATARQRDETTSTQGSKRDLGSKARRHRVVWG
jgi:hypothetical protein